MAKQKVRKKNHPYVPARFYEYDSKESWGVSLQVKGNGCGPELGPLSVSFHLTVDDDHSIRGTYLGPRDVHRLVEWLTVWAQDHPLPSENPPGVPR